VSKIIKGGGPPQVRDDQDPNAVKVIEREVLLAHGEARTIVDSARSRARAIVEEAEREAEALRSAAREEGHARGLAEWEHRILAVGDAVRERVDASRQDVVHLAIRMAEKILRRRLEEDPGVLLPMLEEALATLRSYQSGQVRVRVHPSDREAIEQRRSEAAARDSRWRALDLVADDKLERGSLRVETDFGTIEADVTTQLAAIEAAFRRGGLV
jgi:flagellar assembly protein FliH